MSTWKAVERRVATFLGGDRVPITGRVRGSAPDVDHKHLSIEVKHRKSLPLWLVDAMDQAVKSMRGERIPIVILHEKGKMIGDCLVLCELKNFRDILHECGRYKGVEHTGD